MGFQCVKEGISLTSNSVSNTCNAFGIVSSSKPTVRMDDRHVAEACFLMFSVNPILMLLSSLTRLICLDMFTTFSGVLALFARTK